MSEIITQFENTIAQYTGAPYAVALDSCTSSVYNCLKFYNPKSITLPIFKYIPQIVSFAITELTVLTKPIVKISILLTFSKILIKSLVSPD